MNEFQNYVPSYWMDDGGMVSPIESHRESKSAAIRSTSPITSLVKAVTVGALLTFATLDLHALVRDSNSTFVDAKVASKSHLTVVPDGYWENLQRIVEAAPRLPESDGVNYPPVDI